MTLVGSKPKLSSKTLHGLIAAGIGWALTWVGVLDVPESEIIEVVQLGFTLVGNLAEIVGLGYAWFGRTSATQTLK